MTQDKIFFPIGILSKKTDCKIPTIRYYEDVGLLQEAHRSEGNQRRYQTAHLERLMFIRHARELGFSIEDIRELIHLSSLSSEQHQADDIAAKHLQEIESKMSRLKALKKELKSMLDDCKQGQTRHCNVIEMLSDHTLCKGEH